MLFPSPNPKPKKCSKPPLDKEDDTINVLCPLTRASRACAEIPSPSSRPGGMTLTPFETETHLPFLYTLVQQSKLKMCGETSFKNIKYKTLPYSYFKSLYLQVYLFKKNVKDTVIQHNSSFSFLLSTSLKRNPKSRTHSSEVRLPSEGCGSLRVHQAKVCLPRATLARTFKRGRSRGLCPLEAK